MVSYWGDQKVKGRHGHYAAWFWLLQPYDWNLPDGGCPQLFVITYRLQSPSKAWCHGSVEWHDVEGWALQTHTSLYITLSQIAWHSIALHHITLYHIALLFILGQHKNKHSVQALSNGLRIALASAPLPSLISRRSWSSLVTQRQIGPESAPTTESPLLLSDCGDTHLLPQRCKWCNTSIQ